MRIINSIVMFALVMAPAAANAQTATDVPVNLGSFNLGARTTSTTGQPARYERFRDLSDGLFLDGVTWKVRKNGWFLNVGADHVGRTDQKYTANFVLPGSFKAFGSWDQIPFLMSQTTRTPYTETSPGVFEIPDATQLSLQNMSTSLRYPAFTALVAASPAFELKSKRHTAAGGFQYTPNEDLLFKVNVKRTSRTGAQPFGAYLSTEIELPHPIDQNFTDLDASVETSRGRALFRVGYTGSWFTNNASPVVFDNPAQLEDRSGTPGRGRLPQQAPDSSRLGVNAMVSVKLPRRSRVTAYTMFATLKDGGQPIIPFTINSAVETVPLYRSTVNGKAETMATNLTFTSRPTDMVNVVVKYRYFDYDNQTPLYPLSAWVRYDRDVRTSDPPIDSEAFSVKRNDLDADLYLTPVGRATFSVGGSRYAETRNHRFFTDNVENTGRVRFDVVGNGAITVRSVYEYSQRRGNGFDENVLLNVSEKVTMRHFDIADRNRSRASLVGAIQVDPNWSLNLSTSIGKDDYLNSGLGLRDNKHNIYSAGFTGTPNEQVALGLSYSYEDYQTKQMNNTTRSTTDIDPAANFSTAGDDIVHSVIASVDVTGIRDKVDLRTTYDYNRTRATYTFGIGDPVPSSLDVPVPLPTIKSDLTRATIDGIYHINSRIAVGVTYWYDKYALTDYTLDAQAIQARVPGNYLLLGYAFEPYTAHTTWGRLIVNW